MQTAQKNIRKILDADRHAMAAADVPHTYADKFALAEFCTRTASSACADVFLKLGLDTKKLKQIEEWKAQGKSITLRCAQSSSCKFLREATREVESASKVKTTTKVLGIKSTKTTSAVHQVTDFFFEVRECCFLLMLC